MNRPSIALALALIFVACGEAPTEPSLTLAEDVAPEPLAAKAVGGAWTVKVTGGGGNYSLDGTVEYMSLSVKADAAGEVSGNMEYGNWGLQDWRYALEPECVAVSPDGIRTAVIGRRTLAQGQDAPPEGTRVVFLLEDHGAGSGVDRGIALFAGTGTCEQWLAFAPPRFTWGNYRIVSR